MHADKLTLNQPVVMAKTDAFRSVITRVSAENIEIVYFDQKTNDETLRMHGRVDGTSSEIVKFDKVYWLVSVNGRPATESDLGDIVLKQCVNIKVDAGARSLDITVN